MKFELINLQIHMITNLIGDAISNEILLSVFQ
jgi:hypothetical protein